MKIWWFISFIAVFAVSNVCAQSPTPIRFDFEQNVESWHVPDWALSQKDHVCSGIEISEDYASRGDKSLKLDCDFPGNAWRAALIEYQGDLDLSGYKTISVDVYFPKKIRTHLLRARIIITAGPWYFIENKKPVDIKLGRWTTIKAKLDVNEQNESLNWKVRKRERGLMANIERVRKIDVRIEYNANMKNAVEERVVPLEYVDDFLRGHGGAHSMLPIPNPERLRSRSRFVGVSIPGLEFRLESPLRSS